MSGIDIMQLTVHEMNEYAQWEILNSSCTLTCHFRIKTWENVTVDEMYSVLMTLIQMSIAQKPTLKYHTSENCCQFTSFFRNSRIENTK
jgi:hypothetical protein